MSKVNNSPSRVGSSKESTTKNVTISDLIAGPSVVQSGFIVNAKAYGFRNTLRCYLGRYLYMLRLWKLREHAILRTLLLNYEKIPKNTPSKFLIGVFHKSAIMKNWLLKSEKRLYNKIMCIPSQVKMTDNNS